MGNLFETPFSVLGYCDENGEWAAVALELDIWGFGDTKEESVEMLLDAVAAQLSFAEYKDNPDLLFNPAPVEYFNLFAEVRSESLKAKLAHTDPDDRYFASGAPFPSITNSNGFAVANG